MKRLLCFGLCAILSFSMRGQTVTAPASSTASASSVIGLWENSSRFVQFTPDGKMRIVLKPYYGFVYEDTGTIPYVIDSIANPLGESSAVSQIAVRYAGEKTAQFVPSAIIGNGLYFRFYRKLDAAAILALSGSTDNMTPTTMTPPGAAAADSATTAGTVATAGTATTAGTVATANTPANAATSAPVTVPALAGFWMAEGNADELRLYRSDDVKEFFCYYFAGDTYYLIRYWQTDARFKDVQAQFSSKSGESYTIPKFIKINETLYTCITSTGSVLRNYEYGTFALADGTISFKPSNIAYSGTAARVRVPVSVVLSGDGIILAFGKPYLSRSKITDLDAEIKAHNGLRRPPRKPVFDYMKLDFHWDEVEAIRNEGATVK